AYDEFLQGFLTERGKHRLLKKLQTEIIPAEFPQQKIPAADIATYFNNTLEFGFKTEGSVIQLVKVLCYLSGDVSKLTHYWCELEKEYGNDLTEVEISELLYEKVKIVMESKE
ncbi:hypothetical protein EDC44_1491, partial [Cricetibacter osteomyelitidis]